MNWMNFSSKNPNTWPISHKNVFVIVDWLVEGSEFYLGRFNIDFHVEEVFDNFAWAYIMPYELRDTNLDDFLSKCQSDMIIDACTFEQANESKSFKLSVLEYVYLLTRLHVYLSDYILSNSNLNSHFTHDMDVEKFFILQNGKDFYLVDNDGYSYCKKTIRLELQ